MLNNLLKAAAGIVTLPVAVVVDAVTLPSIAYDDNEFNTAKVIRNIAKNIDEASK